MSVSYGGDSITFADSSVISTGWTGFKNRVINGTMMVDQRNAGANANASNTGTWSVDRFQIYKSNTVGIITISQSTDAPTGHFNSLKVTVNTATSITSGDFNIIRHPIEGVNMADLAWGTSAAKTVTVSFWVKCSIAGQHSFYMRSGNNGLYYVAPYTINATNTWEYKTITITPPQSGTFNTGTTSMGVQLAWDLGSGSSSAASSPNQWLTVGPIYGTYYNTPVTVASTTGATFAITGVQFEVGSTASSFEWRPYGTELALCQRYFVRMTGRATGYVRNPDGLFQCFIILPNNMRTEQPSGTFNNLGVFSNFQTTVASSPSNFSIGGESKCASRGFLYIDGSLGSYSGHTFIPSWEGFSFDVSSEL